MGTENNGQRSSDRKYPEPDRIDSLMHQAVKEHVFPGAVLLVSKNDSILFHRAYGFANQFSRRRMTLDTFFDLASLTKPLATSLAVMMLKQQGRIHLGRTLGETLPAFRKDEKSAITILHLLQHNSGLTDYRPYYMEIGRLPPEKRLRALRKLLVQEATLHPPGAKVVYSDIGFMILEWLVERVSGKRLDRFVSETVYEPLKLDGLFFVDLNSKKRPAGVFAATEQCSWRQMTLEGQVHDENAYVVGGIQGHAGLFGTAAAVHLLLRALLDTYHGNSPQSRFQTGLVRSFLRRRPGSDRALGFDTPSLHNSSAGTRFSSNSVGHLGFTGTSFWMDLDRRIMVILLTNRVHPTRDNLALKAFRPKLHDAVMQSLLSDII